MLAPLRNRHRIGGVSSVVRSVPAPVGGWDAKNSLADMPEAHAIVLDNVFPDLKDVRLRNGFSSYATGIGASNVETLMEYAGPAGSEFYAAGNSAIYDISSSGAVGAAVVSSLSSVRFQHTMFSASGANYLWICNGADAPQHYNGAAWVAPSLSGITATDVVNVAAHQSRLFLALNNKLAFYYLPIKSVAGAVTAFDLDPIFDKGGYLQAIGSWTRDGGAGVDDVVCFVTSEGQVALYAGSDPATADDWALIGVFNIGKPIGRRCLFKVGSELIVITEDGYVSLSSVLPLERVNVEGAAVSDKIRNAAKEAARSFVSNFGWQCIFYPRGSYALFNVPTSSTVMHQHVVNTQTGAWCRFTGQNARCWGVYAGDLYFGGIDGAVYKADTGVSDNGAVIEGVIKPAFNYFGNRNSVKHFKMMRPLMVSNGSIPVAIRFNVDYEDVSPSSVPTAPVATGGIWDTDLWDAGVWAPGNQLVSPWLGVNGVGRAGAPNIAIRSATLTFSLKAFDVMYEEGGLL